MMKEVIISDILEQKGKKVFSIGPEEMVFEGIKLMSDKSIGALLVMDREKVVGIFTERDYARKVILANKSSKEIPIKEIMTKNIIYINPEMSIKNALGIMSEKKIRHLPVMKDDKCIGLVSIGDLVSRLIDEQQHAIDHLIRYMTG